MGQTYSKKIFKFDLICDGVYYDVEVKREWADWLVFDEDITITPPTPGTLIPEGAHDFVASLEDEDMKADTIEWSPDDSFSKTTLKDFLISKGVNWNLFLENCKIENQRWRDFSFYYDGLDELKNEKAPCQWISEAFNWEYALQDDIDFIKINAEWENDIIEKYETVEWD